jgi:hypothetical protein
MYTREHILEVELAPTAAYYRLIYIYTREHILEVELVPGAACGVAA